MINFTLNKKLFESEMSIIARALDNDTCFDLTLSVTSKLIPFCTQ